MPHGEVTVKVKMVRCLVCGKEMPQAARNRTKKEKLERAQRRAETQREIARRLRAILALFEDQGFYRVIDSYNWLDEIDDKIASFYVDEDDWYD